MKKTRYIWFNNKLVKWDEAKVHLLTHSLHYGSAAFEGIRFYNTERGPAVFRLKEHIDRFLNSAEVLGMKLPFSKNQLIKTTLNLIKKNKIKQGYIRPIAFFGYGKMGLSPIGVPLNVAIAVWPWGRYLEKDIVKVKTSSFCRLFPKSGVMGAKISGHYFNSILATLEAKKFGFDEALLLDYKGFVAEGPGENIFIVKNKKIITPKKRTILPGITRQTVITLAKDLGYKVVEKNIKLPELKRADECFFVGTAAEVSPIGQIDKVKICKGEIGPITRELQELYKLVVTDKIKKYQKWLTYI